ncbi:hypothetical protein [Kineosporia sp. R_H_3]|nr:hypothetical protein [Kineosporia sp. R_H_3]
MTRRYDQSELNTYGAEDDEEMDSILKAIDRANEESKPTPTLPNPKPNR